jgi:hypothetical protein
MHFQTTVESMASYKTDSTGRACIGSYLVLPFILFSKVFGLIASAENLQPVQTKKTAITMNL